jgi:multisubunit Na+/H+ antiporter MnhC subunit
MWWIAGIVIAIAVIAFALILCKCGYDSDERVEQMRRYRGKHD